MNKLKVLIGTVPVSFEKKRHGEEHSRGNKR